LYHGTDTHRTASLAADGLQPADRRWLHLSGTLDEAVIVARRKTDRPSVLQISALEAHRAGVEFYHEARVYLVRHVPAAFVTVVPMPAAPAASSLPADPR
jgi:putative RNA 2'-phosphotransferase